MLFKFIKIGLHFQICVLNYTFLYSFVRLDDANNVAVAGRKTFDRQS